MDVEILICPVCGAEFVPNQKAHGVHTYCSKRCQAFSYRQTHKGKAKKDRAEYYRNNREAIRRHYREWSYATEYGITLEDYKTMLENQDGACAICGRRKYSKHGLLSVDHDHETGETRGLLCHRCNLLLGLAKDSDELLLMAAGYLRDYGKRR